MKPIVLSAAIHAEPLAIITDLENLRKNIREEISDTDAEHLTDENCDEASFRSYHILRRNWDFVVRVADALISDESLTDWQILQLREGQR